MLLVNGWSLAECQTGGAGGRGEEMRGEERRGEEEWVCVHQSSLCKLLS